MEQALIDTDHLDMYIAGDDALRDEILAIFEEQTRIWASMLDPSAEDLVWREAVHALKGAARGVGAWQLGDICEEAEDLVGSAARRSNRPDTLKKIRKIGRETISEVRRLRDMPTA